MVKEKILTTNNLIDKQRGRLACKDQENVYENTRQAVVKEY